MQLTWIRTAVSPGLAPDAVKEGFFTEDDARVLGEEQEEFKFLIGQAHFPPL